jgi:hypothetical protein
MPTEPLDYLAYSRILDRADIRQRVRKMASRAAALRSLVAEEPTDAHQQALARYTGAVIRQASASVTTPAARAPHMPAAVVSPARAPQTPTPPPRPTRDAELEARIAAVQKAQPMLTRVQAQEHVAHEDPALWERQRHMHLYGRELPAPVEKEAPPSYEQVMKTVDTRRAGRANVSREQMLIAMLKELPHGSEVFHHMYAMYRYYHVSGDALRDRDAAVLAKGRSGQVS